MSKKKIYFRADAGPDIGYGHYIRSLALADMLKDDFDCTFFTQTPTEYQKKEAEGVCPLVALPADDTKFALFLEQLHGDEIVVLDNYFFTSEYQLKIKQSGCKLVCIDDMHDKHYYADVVINHGVANVSDYEVECYTQIFIGFDWLLLRKPFLHRIDNPYVDTRTLDFVFAFGGSDPFGLSVLAADIFETKGIKAVGIVGDGFCHGLVKYKYVKFVKNVSAEGVAQLLSSSHYAVIPASTMCLEALACGTKLLMGYYVDNQKYFSDYMGANGYSFDLGNMAKGDFKDKLSDAISSILTGKLQMPLTLFPGGTHSRFINLFKSL